MSTISDALAAHFNRLGISQVEIAKTLGVSKAYVNSLFTGRRPFGKKQAEIWEQLFGISRAWLITGEGEMLKAAVPHPEEDVVTPVADAMVVPLFNLEAVAGFNGHIESEYVEATMPWPGAKDGDFAVHVTGDSMTPRIPDGSIVLARPYPFTSFDDLCFGKVHIVVTDDCAMLKVLKFDPVHPHHVLLVSYNENYPPRSIPASEIRHIYLAVAVQAPL